MRIFGRANNKRMGQNCSTCVKTTLTALDAKWLKFIGQVFWYLYYIHTMLLHWSLIAMLIKWNRSKLNCYCHLNQSVLIIIITSNVQIVTKKVQLEHSFWTSLNRFSYDWYDGLFCGKFCIVMVILCHFYLPTNSADWTQQILIKKFIKKKIISTNV